MVEQDRFEELCAGYVFGALSDAETNEFESSLKNATPAQREHFNRARQTSLMMAASLQPIAPRDALKDQLMARISGAKSRAASDESSFLERFKASFNWMTAVPGLAAAALAIVMFVQNSQLSTSLEEQRNLVANLEGQLGQQRNQIAQAESKVSEQAEQVAKLAAKAEADAELFAFLTSAQLQVASMQGLGENTGSAGKVYWDKTTGNGWVQFRALQPPPSDRDYQLWLIISGKPVSMGTFTFTDTTGGRFFKLNSLKERDPSKIQAFAVTIEPKGGVESPTGAMVMKGAI